MTRASGLHCLDEALAGIKLAAGGTESGLALAQAIARAILDERGLRTFDRRDLSLKCRAFCVADERLRRAALLLLVNAGWLHRAGHTTSRGVSYRVDPHIHELHLTQGEATRK